MKIFKKTALLVILLISPVFLFSVTIEELEGTWNWPKPVFKQGVMKIEKWLDYTFEVYRVKKGFEYVTRNENNTQIDKGSCYILDGILVLDSTVNGNKDLYNIGQFAPDNSEYELSTALGAGPIFIITRATLSKTDPVKAEQLAKEARAYNDQRNYAIAIELADEAIGYDANCLSAWFQKGFALGATGRHAEAVECYNAVLTIDPGYKQAKSNIKWNQDRMK